MNKGPIVCDYGSGDANRVSVYWSNVQHHNTSRGIVCSRRNIVDSILTLSEWPSSSRKKVIAFDPHCFQTSSQYELEWLSVLTTHIRPQSPPNILFVCNPPCGVHETNNRAINLGLDYSEYLPGVFAIAESMSAGSYVFIQLDRAFVEDFPDTEPCTDDNQKFWKYVWDYLRKIGFMIIRDKFLLWLTLDRYGPLESKLFVKC